MLLKDKYWLLLNTHYKNVSDKLSLGTLKTVFDINNQYTASR